MNLLVLKNEMIHNVNMLGIVMELEIVNKFDGTLIVQEDANWIELKISKINKQPS